MPQHFRVFPVWPTPNNPAIFEVLTAIRLTGANPHAGLKPTAYTQPCLTRVNISLEWKLLFRIRRGSAAVLAMHCGYDFNGAQAPRVTGNPGQPAERDRFVPRELGFP